MPGSGTQGRFGTVTEPLGDGLFVMSYETITGNEEDLQLQKVDGQLKEAQTTWKMHSPSARKAGGVWTLFGPMDLDSWRRTAGAHLGHGTIESTGPALGWDRGVWHGLAPLVWEDLQGSGRGRWDLPAGWRRGLDGKFVVDKGPVHWQATEPGTVQAMTAERMWAVLGSKVGHLEDVQAQLAGGQVRAQVVDVEPAWIRWSPPVSFVRDDGWHGDRRRRPGPPPPGRRLLREGGVHRLQGPAGHPRGDRVRARQRRPVDSGGPAPGGQRAPGAAPGPGQAAAAGAPGAPAQRARRG